jgi:hypothetical protein
MRKVNRFMEHFLAGGGHRHGGSQRCGSWCSKVSMLAMQWFWFPGIALAMYFFRRFMRGRLEAMVDRENDKILKRFYLRPCGFDRSRLCQSTEPTSFS